MLTATGLKFMSHMLMDFATWHRRGRSGARLIHAGARTVVARRGAIADLLGGLVAGPPPQCAHREIAAVDLHRQALQPGRVIEVLWVVHLPSDQQ